MSFCSTHHNAFDRWLDPPKNIVALEDVSITVAILSHGAGRSDIPLEFSPEGASFRKKIANLLCIFGKNQLKTEENRLQIKGEWSPIGYDGQVQWEHMDLNIQLPCRRPQFLEDSSSWKWTLNHAIALLSSQILLMRLVTYVRLRLLNGSYFDLKLDDILEVIQVTNSLDQALTERSENAVNIDNLSKIPAVRAVMLYYVRDYHTKDKELPFNYDFLKITVPYILEGLLVILDLSIEYLLEYKRSSINIDKVQQTLISLERNKDRDKAGATNRNMELYYGIIEKIRSDINKK